MSRRNFAVGVLASWTYVTESTFEETTYSVIIPMVMENSIKNNSSNLQNYKIECPKEGELGGGAKLEEG